MTLTQQQPQWLTMSALRDGALTSIQYFFFEQKMREEMASAFDLEFGPGNWSITPTAKLPEGFDPAMYTVENGELVPASAQVLAVRREAENVRKAEEIRLEREERYRSETDPMLFNAMEAYAAEHPEETVFAPWLAAKERIREELPKP